MTRFAAVAIGLALAVFLARTAHMQTPTPAAPPASTSIVVASPTYVSIPMEITVNRPAAEVWKRIGGYCAIAEWFQIPNCTITQGKDGELGGTLPPPPPRGGAGAPAGAPASGGRAN
jgi:hypothetical protein